MKPKKGERYRDYIGNLCFISYIRGDVVKLTFIDTPSYTEVWDKKDFMNEVWGNRFFHQPQEPINRTNISEHLIEYQLNIIGKTTEQAKSVKEWYSKWTMTSKQHELFKAYTIPLLRKVFKINKKKAEEIFNWFDLSFGLRIKD